MLYAVGSKIDLTGLNTKKAVAAQPKKSDIETALEAASETAHYYQAGTQLIFDRKTGRLGRRIRVDFP